MGAKKQKNNQGKKRPGNNIKQENNGFNNTEKQKDEKKKSHLLSFVPLLVLAIAYAMSLYMKNTSTSADEASSLPVDLTTPASGVQVELPPPDPKMEAFVKEACKVAFCHTSLAVAKRTLRAAKGTSKGETFLRIPRSMQIWDLDAMRDPFIQKHLLSARHKRSGNHLGSEAFLAAFLALEIQRAKESPDDMEPMRKAYLEFLPTFEELKNHPILWDKEQAKMTLGERSKSNIYLTHNRHMVDAEYYAFKKASPDFAEKVRIDEYAVARINVLTRSFPMGPPSEAETLAEGSLSEELKSYLDSAGIDFMDEKQGCRGMVPIADLLNHHPKHTVRFKYEGKEWEKQEFVIDEHRDGFGGGILAGSELMVSYGEFSDAQLFARYGFVNGDGSGMTEASINFHHDILNLDIAPQFNLMPYSGVTKGIREYQNKQIRNYFVFDDGYAKCIEGPDSNPEEAELKRLKFEHLVKIANNPERWKLSLPPRQPNSQPAQSTDHPITMEPPVLHLSGPDSINMSAIQSTCRLIALINSDYDWRAIEVLRDNLENDDFLVREGNDALEFRSLACIKRFVDSEVAQLVSTVPFHSLHERVKTLNEEDYGSSRWAAYHSKFADVQSLLALSQQVKANINTRFMDKRDNPPVEYNIMSTPCSLNYTDFLLQ